MRAAHRRARARSRSTAPRSASRISASSSRAGRSASACLQAAGAAGAVAHRGEPCRRVARRRARCAHSPRRRTRARCQAADRRRRRRHRRPASCSASRPPGTPITRMRWSLTCARQSRTATPHGSGFCRPGRWRSCRCPTAAPRSSGASHARRRERLRALDAARFAAALLERRARGVLGEIELTTPRGELSAAAAICARLRAAARGAARRRRARRASVGRAGTESGVAGLRLARRGARRGGRSPSCSASTGSLRRYERWRKSENLLAADGAGRLGAAVLELEPAHRAAARRRTRGGRAGCLSSSASSRSVRWGSRATCRPSLKGANPRDAADLAQTGIRSIFAAQMKSFCDRPPIECVEIGDVAVVVADLEIGVMVLDVRDMRERVDEAHGAVEVLELERALQALRVRRRASSRG